MLNKGCDRWWHWKCFGHCPNCDHETFDSNPCWWCLNDKGGSNDSSRRVRENV